MDGQRDLNYDLEICDKATPGPWKYEPGEWDCNKECGDPAPCLKEVSECGYIKQLYPANVIGPFIIECDAYCGLNDDNAKFVAAARDGWPEAIKRAIVAESLIENAGKELKDWMQRVTELEKENAELKGGISE